MFLCIYTAYNQYQLHAFPSLSESIHIQNQSVVVLKYKAFKESEFTKPSDILEHKAFAHRHRLSGTGHDYNGPSCRSALQQNVLESGVST